MFLNEAFYMIRALFELNLKTEITYSKDLAQIFSLYSRLYGAALLILYFTSISYSSSKKGDKTKRIPAFSRY